MRTELLVLIVLIFIGLISFFGIVSEINKNYSVELPAFGGTLREGIVGNPHFMNPLLSQTDPDRDVVSLVYTGLMRYDKNGALVPALMKGYEVSKGGLEYTVTLKDKLRWSSGKKLTADDVVFTIQLAKNPQAQSPSRANWEGVEVSKIDDQTIRFQLKKAYAPFLDNLTLGIIPKYLWEEIPPSQLSLAKINTEPIGAGPYKIESSKRDSAGSIASITLSANKYFVLGKPNIKNLLLNFYAKEDVAVKDLRNGFLDSLGGISPKYLKELEGKKTIESINLQRVIAIFLNQGSDKNLASADVRKALSIAVDRAALIEKVLGNYGIPISGPLPSNIVPNKNTTYDPELAKTLLQKSKKNVAITITTANTPELIEIAEMVRLMWETIGVKTDIQTFDFIDLEQLVIGPRRYTAFLYGEEVVGQNPDPFAFWHSSQRAHPGYNIALYANSKVDKALEEVRTTSDQKLREELYATIHKDIEKDAPAIFLFSPSYVYVVPKKMRGADIKTISTGSERFAAIHEWYLSRQYVWNIFAK